MSSIKGSETENRRQTQPRREPGLAEPHALLTLGFAGDSMMI